DAPLCVHVLGALRFFRYPRSQVRRRPTWPTLSRSSASARDDLTVIGFPRLSLTISSRWRLNLFSSFDWPQQCVEQNRCRVSVGTKSRLHHFANRETRRSVSVSHHGCSSLPACSTCSRLS